MVDWKITQIFSNATCVLTCYKYGWINNNLHMLNYPAYLQTKIYLLHNKLANMLWIVCDFERNPYIKFSK